MRHSREKKIYGTVHLSLMPKFKCSNAELFQMRIQFLRRIRQKLQKKNKNKNPDDVVKNIIRETATVLITA